MTRKTFPVFTTLFIGILLTWIVPTVSLIASRDKDITIQEASIDPKLAIKYWEERGVSKELQIDVGQFITENGKASQEDTKKRAALFYMELGKDKALLVKNSHKAWIRALERSRYFYSKDKKMHSGDRDDRRK